MPGRQSLPLSAVEAAPLKACVDPLRPNRPEPTIRPGQRVDLHFGELESPVSQRREDFHRSFEKVGAKLFVREDLPND